MADPTVSSGGCRVVRRDQTRVEDVTTRPDRAGEAALVAAVHGGDEVALAELYDRFAGLVHGVAHRVTGDRGAAEEVTQEVFTHLWRNAERFDPARGSVRSWLAVMAYRRGVDWMRAEAARRRAVRPTPDEHQASAEDAAIAGAVAERVRAAVDGLPQSQRELVHRLYFDGWTVREVAASLGVPEGTAKTRLRAARQRLAACLGPEGLVPTA